MPGPFRPLSCAALVVLAALAVVAPATAQAQTRTLTVVKQGFQTGTVTSSPAGIVCGATCTNTFAEEMGAPAPVTLTTTLPSGFSVVWQGLTCQEPTQTGTACTVAADNNTITARYIDATAPTVSLTRPTSAGPFSGQIEVAASAFDSQSSVARVDFMSGSTLIASDTTAPYTAVFDTTLRPDGQTSVTAVAFNGDNQAKTSNPRSITIDNTAPELTITGPDGETFGPGTSQTFNFTATDANTPVTACSINSETEFAECNELVTFTDLPGGDYVFRVRALDSAGNQALAARSFSIDGTGPTAMIVSGPAEFSRTAGSAVAFGFAADEAGAGFACRLYRVGAAAPDFGACSGADSHAASGLGPGDWVFEVFATDAYGNAGPTAVRRFVVVFAGGPASISARLAAAFRVKGSRTRVRRLRLSSLPRGTRVRVTCRNPKRARSCPFRRRSLRDRDGRALLESLFRRRALLAGTLVEIRVTAAGLRGEVFRIRARTRRRPARQSLCLAPGASKPTAC